VLFGLRGLSCALSACPASQNAAVGETNSKTLNLNIALLLLIHDFFSLVLLVDNMKLAEKLEIDELVAHLEAPENSDLLTNV
jgi:hypothetical protein